MKIKKLDSFFEKTVGVSFKSEIEPVYFETRWGIHTFFVQKPIDVFVLDENFVVTKVKRNLKPWRVFIWKPVYNKIVEAPVGMFKISTGKRMLI